MRWHWLVVAAAAAASAVEEPLERREIRSPDEFRRLVQESDRAFLVEFFSGMCGYCTEFEPTWLQLARQASRLEPARVNIDLDGGMQLAEQLKILDEGIPAVVVFNRKETDGHETLMAGELVELPRLLKRLYRTTKGQYLRTDSAGYFLRAGAGR